MLRTSDLEYHLPHERIATRPAEPRDSARLMVVSRTDGRRIDHARVADLPTFLRAEDLLVRNVSRVAPARLRGRRRDTGGAVEGLFLRELPSGAWEALLRSNGRLRTNAVIDLHTPQGEESGVVLTLLERAGDGWRIHAAHAANPGAPLSAHVALSRAGATPLPPYILKARRDARISLDDALDRAWYQTVYAANGQEGSIAAPTAGLHFTPELLDRVEAAGARWADVTLHVGTGTFKPVESAFVEEHPMHAEWCEVGAETLRAVERARAKRGVTSGRDTSGGDGRVLAIGTTSARALESVPADAPSDADWRAETRLLITPGYEWKRVDAMLTNFHLPRSTLLAMVAALFPGPDPVRRLLSHYNDAITSGYRFYSYGDAMLVLP